MPYYRFDVAARLDNISKNPYKYLLSIDEEAKARAYISRALLMGGLAGLLCYRRIKITGQAERAVQFNSVSGIIYSLIWRSTLGVSIGYILGRKFLLDREKVFEHSAAKDEIRKIMRFKQTAKEWHS